MMRVFSPILIGFYFIISCLNYSHATTVRLPIQHLRTGDLILVSLQCRLCQMIESEEDSKFSHMAMIIKSQTSVLFTEAWSDGVTTKTYEEFFKNKKLTPGSEMVILRKNKWGNLKAPIYKLVKSFEGLSYDSHFLWNNFDDLRREKLYCSEYIYKLYQNWLLFPLQLRPKAMSFHKNWNAWYKYFQGKVPQGKLGISPEDFYRSSEFKMIFKLRIN